MKETIASWIKNLRLKGKSWEWLMMAGKSSDEELSAFLREREEYDSWDTFTPSEWRDFVEEQKRLNEITERIMDEAGATVLSNTNEDNSIVIPFEEDSAWQCYRRKMRSNGFGEQTISTIEKSAIKTLKHLSRNTSSTGPIKGLVVGNVQSGKTANMAALIAMAVDNGWNMVIVLSGIIEALRIQTLKRLNDDLNNNWNREFNSRLDWKIIEQPEKSEQYGKRVQDYDFSIDSKNRYLTVCLKNSTRLRNLIDWLSRGGEKRKDIKLLIIDDEADQASINTSSDERTRINNLILNLINNRDSNGKEIQDKFGAVNYIGYTATPFANVLSESPGVNSLYPSNFIATLAVSDEYFGPQQIFGCSEAEFEGLDIVRNIPDNDITEIINIHDSCSIDVPATLKDAICWFMCGVSCLRYWNYNKPLSLLVHTSRKTDHHEQVASVIQQWIENTRPNLILKYCEELWNKETTRFKEGDFKKQYPNYNRNGGQDIRSLPSFDEIREGVIRLLEAGISPIKIDRDETKLQYSNGIHLCIDNSSRNDDPESMRRLVYPDSESMPEEAPAFIVVGGQTLSRGLTIEGLISTFFLRSSLAADTLMQMGRWFGYRRGYELLPRIWMSDRARRQFEFMSDMDDRLRKEIKRMDEMGTDFSEVGPRIITSPEASLIRIVSSNKMRGAVDAEFDFSGHTMETGVFTNDKEVLIQNLDTATGFIRSLGVPSDKLHINRHNYLWEGIELNKIISFLKTYIYSERLKGFNDIDPLIEWLKSFTDDEMIGKWNVVLAGNQTGENKWEPMEGISINKVSHAQRGIRKDNGLNIGVLRSPEDFLTDIRLCAPEEERNIKSCLSGSHKLSDLNELRAKFGLRNTPQIVLYVIDKNSKPRPGSSNRYPLSAEADIVGFSINIPGERKGRSAVKAVKINIPNKKDRLDIIE